MDEQEQVDNQQEEQAEFTIKANEIYSEVINHMDKTQKSNLDQLLGATNDLLFKDEKTNKLLDELTKSQNIGKDLGEGAFNLLVVMMKHSNQIPGDIIDSCGMIMIARVCEYLAEAGTHVTDDDYEEAVHTFITLVHSKFDPEYQERMRSNGFDHDQKSEQPNESAEQDSVAQQGTPQGVQQVGILGRGV